MPFHFKTPLLWRCNVVGNIKRTEVFTENDRYVCPISTKLGVSRKVVIKVSSTKFHGNPSCGSRADTDTRTDGRMGMMKLISAFSV